MICGSSGRTGASSAGGASATSSAQSSDISTSERQEILTSETVTWNQRLPKLDTARARLHPRRAPWSTARSAGSPSWLPGPWCLRWTILEAEPVEIISQYVLSTHITFQVQVFSPCINIHVCNIDPTSQREYKYYLGGGVRSFLDSLLLFLTT